MIGKEIFSLLPYREPFLFVDELSEIDDNGVRGKYTFKEDSFFYKGHFKDHPVTPGVILTETMAQIGVVCLGIYLLKENIAHNSNLQIALTSHQADFFLPVKPGEQVTVQSEKIYFRFNKLKCKVKLFNKEGDLVCSGTISGMFKPESNE